MFVTQVGCCEVQLQNPTGVSQIFEWGCQVLQSETWRELPDLVSSSHLLLWFTVLIPSIPFLHLHRCSSQFNYLRVPCSGVEMENRSVWKQVRISGMGSPYCYGIGMALGFSMRYPWFARWRRHTMNDELELDGNWTVGNVARKRHGTTGGMENV